MELSSPRRNTPVPLVVPFIFHPPPRHLVSQKLIPRHQEPRFSLSLFVLSQWLACCILKKRDVSVKAHEEEGMGEYDQGVLKEGRGNDVFRNETSARIEKGWREGEELKGEKRSLKSCELLTFVIEFSPSAISVLFARLTTSSLCFSSSLPTFFLFSVCTSILSLPPSFLPLKNRILTVLVVSLIY